MTDGDRLKIRGMISAKSKEERDNPGFTERALMAIHEAATNNAVVHVDHVLNAFKEKAVHPNCWGSIWSKARKLGFLELTGELRQCDEDSGKHSHAYPVYRSLIHGGTNGDAA